MSVYTDDVELDARDMTLIGSALFGFGLLRRQRRAAFARLPNF
jgi:hypothetical protein